MIGRNRVILVVALFAMQVQAELRDPTRPSYISNETASYLAEVQNRYELSSVLVGDNRRSAVINGKRVTEGDWIDSARVEKIGKSGVTIKVQNTEIKLALSAYDIKK